MLLAKKSPPDKDPVTLSQHTRDVVDAAEAMFQMDAGPSRFAHEWLRFFRLDPSVDYPAYFNNLIAACLFHDWGKANQDMQSILAGQGKGQLFRHEHLSVLMLGYEGVDQWVRQRKDIDWDVVLAAVGSHHLKFSDEAFAPTGRDEARTLLTDAKDFQATLIPFIMKRLSLNGNPRFPKEKYWGFARESSVFDVSGLRDELRNGRLQKLSKSCRNGASSQGRMLNAVRSALIAADAAGSGLRRTDLSVAGWVRKHLIDSESCDKAFVEQIVESRIGSLRRSNKWSKWNEFQIACDSLPARSVLLAPCGAGKTLAAWRWIAAQVARRPAKRILFLYPTRATATEGFKDYVAWAPEAAASLMHGTADYDLDGMFPGEDPRSGLIFNGVDPRLFALRHWSKRVFSATVDQFFSFLSYSYGPMCLLPVLADSVIVVDEVHSFDRSMFSALLGFLRAFDVPVLCMTATLQSGRKEQLREVMDDVYEDRPGELATIADASRYKVSQIQEDQAEQIVRNAVKAGKRVLWVVNQVSRAQAIAANLADIGKPPICYHSRFTLNDRVERHRETVAAIKAGQPASVAVATQVCEMSLDIDADFLITEHCPISSLIQRMGRCRRGREELAGKGPGEVYVYKPAEEKVYREIHLSGLDAFLGYLTAKTSVSQTDLENGLAEFGPKTAEAPSLNSFLCSGAYAVSDPETDSFRDIEAFNVQAVLSNELSSYLSAPKDKQPGFILPVPRKLKPETDTRLPRWLHVADERHYDPKTGFWDTPIH